jgi:hypothetical protein
MHVLQKQGTSRHSQLAWVAHAGPTWTSINPDGGNSLFFLSSLSISVVLYVYISTTWRDVCVCVCVYVEWDMCLYLFSFVCVCMSVCVVKVPHPFVGPPCPDS